MSPALRTPGRFTNTATLPLAMIGLIIAMIWVSITLHLSQERRQYEDAAYQDAGNLARGFGESITRTVEAIDQVMFIVRALYRADPAHFDIAAIAPSDQVLSELTLQISITDAHGIMRGSNLGPSAGVDLSDREHVRIHFTDPSDLLFISRPVLGRVSGKWSIQFTRKLFNPDGSFAGVLVVSLNPDYFARFYTSIDIGKGSILLTGLDGIVRVRAPTIEGAMGSLLSPAGLQRIRGPSLSGEYRGGSRIDSTDRLYSFRRLPKYPLAVIVGLSAEEVFAPYERDRRQYVVVGGFLTLLVVLIGALMIRQGGRLVRSRQALAATLSNIGQGIMMIDSAGRVPVMNNRAMELLGLPPGLVHPGITFREILDWQLATGEFEAQGDERRDIANLARAGGLGPEIYERTRSSGITLEVRTQALDDGSAVRTFTDITDRVRNAAALAAARDAAEAANRAQSDFLAVMSHEIRTPMNAIIGLAGLLIDSELSTNQRHHASTLREAAESLMQIINDILDFSKLEANRLEFDCISFDLAHVLGSVIELLRVKAEEKHLALRTEIAPGTPNRIMGDPGRLRQVLLNLVGNSLKFTQQGSVTISVEGKPPAREGAAAEIHFSVRDTGIGISESAQPRLFERFYQADLSTSRDFGGTGLGLAICRRLVNTMGGEIEVESELGKGSTFRFTANFALDPEPEVADLAATAAPARPSRRLRILLAEDNATNRMVAVTRLEMMGHRVDTVASGSEAVDMVQVVPYDLILMDVMMPEMDGLEATRIIRALPGPVSSIPIVAMTANVFRHHQDECRAAGMNDFLGKPFTPPQLTRVIDRVTATARAATTTQTPPDQAAYNHLVTELGAEAAGAILQAFMAEARERLASMHVDGTPESVQEQASALHDAAASIGFSSIAAQADAVARTQASAALARLDAALEAMLLALQQPE